jgi:uncharacterized protein involved in response to NO
LGLILLGLSYFPKQSIDYLNIAIPFTDALHLLTIAAMGLMIFAMMSRVSLGHTGRALTPKKSVSWVFILIIISALARALLPQFPILLNQPLLSWGGSAWNISAWAWLIAGLIFINVYWSILTTKKIEKSFTRS